MIPSGLVADVEPPVDTATNKVNSGLQQIERQATSAALVLLTQEFLLNLFRIVVQLIPSVLVLLRR